MDREEKSEGDGQRRVPSVCLWRVTGGVQTGAGPPLCTGEPQAGQRSRGFQRLLAVDAESDADANTTNNVDNVDNVARTSLVNGAQPSVVRFIPLALCRPPDSRERLPSHAESSPITTPISVRERRQQAQPPPPATACRDRPPPLPPARPLHAPSRSQGPPPVFLSARHAPVHSIQSLLSHHQSPFDSPFHDPDALTPRGPRQIQLAAKRKFSSPAPTQIQPTTCIPPHAPASVPIPSLAAPSHAPRLSEHQSTRPA